MTKKDRKYCRSMLAWPIVKASEYATGELQEFLKMKSKGEIETVGGPSGAFHVQLWLCHVYLPRKLALGLWFATTKQVTQDSD